MEDAHRRKQCYDDQSVAYLVSADNVARPRSTRLRRANQPVITYLQEENRVLKAQLGGRRLRLTDTERRLATLAHPLGRKRLKDIATLATPDTLLRWYKRLIAQKCDGSTQRRELPVFSANIPLVHARETGRKSFPEAALRADGGVRSAH
jgi:hypothetical protein